MGSLLKTSSLHLTLPAIMFATSAFAADVSPGVSAVGATKTRAQVVAELQQAIANGEIRRGPLADIYESTTNVQTASVSAPSPVRAERSGRPVQDLTKRQPDASKQNLN